MLPHRRVIRLIKRSPFQWDGSYLGTITADQIIKRGKIKIGRDLGIWDLTVDEQTSTCLIKRIDSFLPAIFDELKTIFCLPKIGTHTFRHDGKLMIAYKPFIVGGQVYSEVTLNLVGLNLKERIKDQVRFNLAFREIFGINDTHEKSFILRYKKINDMLEVPTVISFLEPGSVVGQEDTFSPILAQCLIDQWFDQNDPTQSLDGTVASLICLNRDCPSASVGYYRPLVEEVIRRIDPNLITYADLFFDRLDPYLPY